MSLSVKNIIDKIEILQDGVMQIRQAQIVTQDDVEIARNFTRWVREPGDANAQSDPSPIPAIANVLWTDEVISAYQTQQQNKVQI